MNHVKVISLYDHFTNQVTLQFAAYPLEGSWGIEQNIMIIV